MAEVVNTGMRKAIKYMCVVSQTAQFVSLMPKPKDFVTRIIGDVVLLSSSVQKLSENLNKLLDDYASIPGNYLMTQMNAITGSLTSITDRIGTYANNMIDQTVGFAENAVDMVTEMTGDIIDSTGAVTSAVVSLGNTVAHTGATIIGQTDTATDIHDTAEEVLEWIDGGFQTAATTATEPLNTANKAIKDVKSDAKDIVNKGTSLVTDNVSKAQEWVENLIKDLREKMDKLSETMDKGFKDSTGISSISSGGKKIAEGLKESSNDNVAINAGAEIMSSITDAIDNFSIGKVVSAFIGVITQVAIVKLGLDQLPPIDFESMLKKVRDDIKMSPKGLYKQYEMLVDSAYNDYIEFGENAKKIPSEHRNYSSKNYEEFKKEFEGDLKDQRDRIRTAMRAMETMNPQAEDYEKKKGETKNEVKSAIKEIKKFRRKIKKARQATTLKEDLMNELNRFKKEVEYRCNTIKSDWESMMKQYSKAIKEITSFFTSGGSCDMFINDVCDDINKQCNDIKDLCIKLPNKIQEAVTKAMLPSDVGPVFPNPIYKLQALMAEIITIFKFIKDLITCVMAILNDVNKLARLMLNGLNNLKEIFNQLMELLGLKWFMQLIQGIIDMFGKSISDVKERLENTLSPVYFGDTDEYNNAVEALGDFLENEKLTGENKGYLTEVKNMLKSFNEDDAASKLNTVIGLKSSKFKKNKDGGSKAEDAISEAMDELEGKSEMIVAYKSPIVKDIVETSSVEDITSNAGTLDVDIQFAGWHFFHPDIYHTGSKYYKTKLLKKIKSKIIKRAAKTGDKTNGGLRMLNRKKIKKDKAYGVFYWYTYYTEDLEKDCFVWDTADNTQVVDNIIHTQNGSIVQLDDGRQVFVADNMVRQGDYVVVDGKRYRVSKP